MQDNLATITGVDQVVLQQRQDFLRPDSAVVVLVLSDENDCSIMDGSFNWIAAQLSNPNNTPFHLPRAASACATDPNSPCCRSCNSTEGAPPAGCTPLGADPECSKGMWDDQGDHPNLRCWEQKRRFGLDFLYPTSKYAEALTQPTICGSWLAPPGSSTALPSGECGGTRVPNPLFAGGRHPGLVFLVGIVGVPWQDLASDATLASPSELSLLSAGELAAKGRWGWLVPECQEPVSPSELPRPMSICKRWNLADQPDDPFMLESPSPAKSPATGEGPPARPGPMASDQRARGNTGDSDLQYACIFPLPTPKDCASFGGLRLRSEHRLHGKPSARVRAAGSDPGLRQGLSRDAPPRGAEGRRRPGGRRVHLPQGRRQSVEQRVRLHRGDGRLGPAARPQ
ncbi:MAG: hypothetical protein IPM35_17740 [Myxococcales bacterium]|nr:hypothetical protein [Myxococcales bacterium]